jgi:hypothetical protein
MTFIAHQPRLTQPCVKVCHRWNKHRQISAPPLEIDLRYICTYLNSYSLKIRSYVQLYDWPNSKSISEARTPFRQSVYAIVISWSLSPLPKHSEPIKRKWNYISDVQCMWTGTYLFLFKVSTMVLLQFLHVLN